MMFYVDYPTSSLRLFKKLEKSNRKFKEES